MTIAPTFDWLERMLPPRPHRVARTAARIVALVAACVVAAGCGSGGSGTGGSSDAGDARRDAERGATMPAEPADAEPVDACTPPTGIFPAPRSTDAGDLVAAEAELTEAVRAAGDARRPFVTDGTVTVAGGVTAAARLTGAREADGDSEGRLAWRGAASVLLPDGDLQVVDNELALRRDDAPDAGYEALGSASGIALDVGRELLTHPFLLDVVAAGGSAEGVRTVRAVARPADLRAYAGTERQGLATELLLDARSLSIDARIADGVLEADVFRLVTTLPSRLPAPLGGAQVTVVGRTIAGCTPSS